MTHLIFLIRCERPPPKGGGFGLRLKAGLVGRKGRLLHNIEVIIRNLRFLILNVLLSYLVSDVAAGSDPIAPTPEMLTPIALAKRFILRQKLVGTLPLQVLHSPRHRHMRRYPWSGLIDPA